MVNFLVVDCPSAYNVILGHSTLNQLNAMTSTRCLKMKFPTTNGVGVAKGGQVAARRCYDMSVKGEPKTKQTLIVEEVDIRDEKHLRQAQPSEPISEFPLSLTTPNHMVCLGGSTPIEVREPILNFLRKNENVFTWSHEDMPVIDPGIITHRLSINQKTKLVKQRQRSFSLEQKCRSS